MRGSKYAQWRGHPLQGGVQGLYHNSARRRSTPEEVLAALGAKRMSITMLREIDSNELQALSRADNAPKTEMSKLVPGRSRCGEIFSNQKNS
jgi:hypothetical protein